MNKKVKLIIELLIFVIIIVAISVGYNYFVNTNAPKDNEGKEGKKVEVKEITNKKEFDEIINSNNVVLADFYATWCMPCSMMSPVIEEIANENENLKVVKINVDNNQTLAMEYDVMSIPTIIILKNGKANKIFVGVTDKENIISEI